MNVKADHRAAAIAELEAAIAQLEHERDTLIEAVRALSGSSVIPKRKGKWGIVSATPAADYDPTLKKPKAKKRSELSAEAKARIAAAQHKRWAKVKRDQRVAEKLKLGAKATKAPKVKAKVKAAPKATPLPKAKPVAVRKVAAKTRTFPPVRVSESQPSSETA